MAPVKLSTYLSPYKPIPSTVAGWDSTRQATWPATTASLLSVDGQAVLVDALMTMAEGAALADWIAGLRTALSTVYVTHAHADHFFGATTLLQRFPAQLVTRPEIAAAAAVQTAPGYLRIWNGFFPGQIAAMPRVPDGIGDESLLGDAASIRTVLVGQSDVETSSVVHVPDLAVVLSGDVVYNGVHLWLAGSSPDSRSAWLAALDAVERLAPRTIVAGHRDPTAPDDDAARLIDQTRNYIDNFDAAATIAGNPRELVDMMLAKYRAFGNEYTLWVAAASQFDS